MFDGPFGPAMTADERTDKSWPLFECNTDNKQILALGHKITGLSRRVDLTIASNYHKEYPHHSKFYGAEYFED